MAEHLRQSVADMTVMATVPFATRVRGGQPVTAIFGFAAYDATKDCWLCELCEGRLGLEIPDGMTLSVANARQAVAWLTAVEKRLAQTFPPIKPDRRHPELFRSVAAAMGIPVPPLSLPPVEQLDASLYAPDGMPLAKGKTFRQQCQRTAAPRTVPKPGL